MISQSMSRLLWVLFAVTTVVLGYSARDVIKERMAGVGELHVAEGVDGRVVLAWDGRIEAPMAGQLRDAFARHGGAASFALVLNSPGGSLDHGAEVIRLLQSIGPDKLQTYVPSGAQCASMCVPVYLQGGKRMAGPRAQFMFHNVSYVEFFSDDAVSVPANATKVATDRFFARYLEQPGVDAGWLKGMRAAVAADDDVWKSARELVDERSGVVLALQ